MIKLIARAILCLIVFSLWVAAMFFYQWMGGHNITVRGDSMQSAAVFGSILGVFFAGCAWAATAPAPHMCSKCRKETADYGKSVD